jgi:hypothetical protein
MKTTSLNFFLAIIYFVLSLNSTYSQEYNSIYKQKIYFKISGFNENISCNLLNKAAESYLEMYSLQNNNISYFNCNDFGTFNQGYELMIEVEHMNTNSPDLHLTLKHAEQNKFNVYTIQITPNTTPVVKFFWRKNFKIKTLFTVEY